MKNHHVDLFLSVSLLGHGFHSYVRWLDSKTIDDFAMQAPEILISGLRSTVGSTQFFTFNHDGNPEHENHHFLPHFSYSSSQFSHDAPFQKADGSSHRKWLVLPIMYGTSPINGHFRNLNWRYLPYM